METWEIDAMTSMSVVVILGINKGHPPSEYQDRIFNTNLFRNISIINNINCTIMTLLLHLPSKFYNNSTL